MKKTKVENISGFKLELFLRQNKQDVRVALKPGEISWCDPGTSTKSMILYERKHLIKTFDEVAGTIDDLAAANINSDEVLDSLHTTESVEFIPVEEKSEQKEVHPLSPPSDVLFVMDMVYSKELTPLEKAEKEAKEYKEESEKKYKGKKRGRKKKRGPKPGSKRKKDSDSNESSTDTKSE